MHAFDPADPAFLADPYPTYARMRASAPVHEHPLLGMPVAVSHAACSAVLRDRGLGRIWSDAEPAEAFGAFNLLHRNSLLEREGEPHTRLRRLVSAAFDRGHTARLAPWVQRRADALVADLAARIDDGATGDDADLIASVAEPLPVEVIAELLGVPESERGPLRGWSNAIVRMYEPGRTERSAGGTSIGTGRSAGGTSTTTETSAGGTSVGAEAERASAEFVAQLRELAARPARPSGADDLIGGLLAVRDADGARISGDELVGTAALLLMAGHEATVNVIGNGTRALLDHPGQWARLVADPALVPSAVEELIRFDAPLQLFVRTALRDTAVAGFPVAAGSGIGALLGAAARDPDAFTDPDRLDVGRSPNPHLGFGAGVHYCLGAPLARVEIAATLHALRRLLPDMAPAGEPRRRPRFVMRGYHRLPLGRRPR